MAYRTLVLSLVTLLASNLHAAEPDHRDLTRFKNDSGQTASIKCPQDWEQRRQQILAGMTRVMGPLPDRTKLVPLDDQITEETDLDGLTRQKLKFQTLEGEYVPAYLFIPKTPPTQNNTTEKRPAVLCLHQTTTIGKGEPAGAGGLPNLHYALELAQRGYVTLAPDYPSFGDYTFKFPAKGFDSGTMKGIWNHMRAVDFLQSLPNVDGERIGCIGHSLGGHNTIFVSVFDPRIKASVSSCGFNSFYKYYGGNLKGWSSDRYMPRIINEFHANPQEMPFDFPELIAALAPRAFFTNSPIHDANFEVSGVKDCISAAAPIYKLLGHPEKDRKSTRLNSSHSAKSRMPSSA